MKSGSPGEVWDRRPRPRPEGERVLWTDPSNTVVANKSQVRSRPPLRAGLKILRRETKNVSNSGTRVHGTRVQSKPAHPTPRSEKSALDREAEYQRARDAIFQQDQAAVQQRPWAPQSAAGPLPVHESGSRNKQPAILKGLFSDGEARTPSVGHAVLQSDCAHHYDPDFIRLRFEAPIPQPPFGQPPFGQPPFGQPSFGQPSFGQPPFGQPALGFVPMPIVQPRMEAPFQNESLRSRPVAPRVDPSLSAQSQQTDRVAWPSRGGRRGRARGRGMSRSRWRSGRRGGGRGVIHFSNEADFPKL